MEMDKRTAIRPTNPDDVSLVLLPESNNACDADGMIVWHAEWTDHGWPLEMWVPATAEPGLFYRLARTVHDADSAVQAFGVLGPLLSDHEDFWTGPRRGEGFEVRERAYDWGYAAARMRHARDMSRALDDARQGSYEKLSHLVSVKTTATANEAISEGEALLVRWINDGLRENVSLEVRPTAAPGSIIQDQRAAVELAYAPRNLLGSAWLMFAREVVGETVILECPNCHKYYVKTKRNQVYCSDKCRNDAWVREKRPRKNAPKGGESE